MDVNISIDKICLVAGMYEKGLQYYVENSMYVKKIRISSFPYRYQIHFADGSFLQVAEEGIDIPDVRLEFNPNKVDEEILNVMTFLYSARLTRLDLAIDYEEDLGKYEWFAERKSKTYFLSGKGELETVYLGRQGASLMWRVYDKAKEQKENKVWWRVEVQRRFRMKNEEIDKVTGEVSCHTIDVSKYLDDRMFKGLRAVKPVWKRKELDIRERAMIFYLMYNPEVMGELSYHTKKKYLELIKKEGEALKPSPQEVYEENKLGLREELQYWISKAEKNKRGF